MITRKYLQLFLFDTCNQRCSYCHYALTGKVLHSSQLKPFKNKKFFNYIFFFLEQEMLKGSEYTLCLTGGEPLLMPNFDFFLNEVKNYNSKIIINTGLNFSDNNHSIMSLINNFSMLEYIEASLHPMSIDDDNNFYQFLNLVKLLKKNGIKIIVRIVSTKKFINNFSFYKEKISQLEELKVSILFFNHFSSDYPSSYTEDEKLFLQEKIKVKAQEISLNVGLDTSVNSVKCLAGSSLISIDLRTGNISPCITTSEIIIGNIYDKNWHISKHEYRKCPIKTSCSCNLFFNHDLVKDFEDSKNFKRLLNSNDYKYDRLKLGNYRFSSQKNNLNNPYEHDNDFKSLSKEQVNKNFKENSAYFKGNYTDSFHSTFKKFME